MYRSAYGKYGRRASGNQSVLVLVLVYICSWYSLSNGPYLDDQAHLASREKARASDREPVGEIVDSIEGLDEETGYQIERVDPGERPQQPVGGVGAVLPVAPKNGNRQSVADEADEAE